VSNSCLFTPALHAARWKYRTQKIGKNSPSGHRCTTLSGYIFATNAHIDNLKKSLLNSITSPICPYNMANYGELRPTGGWDRFVSLGHPWGAPANFNGCHVLASLLQQCRSMEANRTLHDVWPSPGLVHYIYIFGGSCPVMQKIAKNSPSGRHHTTLSGYFFATKACIDNWKKTC